MREGMLLEKAACQAENEVSASDLEHPSDHADQGVGSDLCARHRPAGGTRLKK
jgi:hypothetical protein